MTETIVKEWICQQCQIANSAENERCSDCQASRSEVLFWECPNCETVNSQKYEVCEVCSLDFDPMYLLDNKKKMLTVFKGTAHLKKAVIWEVPGNINKTTKVLVSREGAKLEDLSRKSLDTILSDERMPIEKRISMVLSSAAAKFMTKPIETRKKWMRWGTFLGALVLWNMLPFGAFMTIVFGGYGAYKYLKSAKPEVLEKLSSGAEKKALELFALEMKEEKREEKYESGHTYPILALSFSQNEKELISIDKMGYLTRWTITSGENRRHSRVFKEEMENIAVSAYGAIVVKMNEIRLYNANADLLQKIKLEVFVNRDSPLTSTVRQDIFALGSTQGRVLVYEPKKGNAFTLRDQMSGIITALQMTDNGKQIISGHNLGALSVWDIKTRKSIFFDLRKYIKITALCYSSEKMVFASAYADGLVRIFSMASFREIAKFQLQEGANGGVLSYVEQMEFIPQRKNLVTVDQMGVCRIWEINKDEIFVIKEFITSSNSINRVSVSPSGKWLGLGSEEGIVSMFDMDNIDVGELTE